MNWKSQPRIININLIHPTMDNTKQRQDIFMTCIKKKATDKKAKHGKEFTSKQ